MLVSAVLLLVTAFAIITPSPASAASPCVGAECDSVALVASDARFTLYSEIDEGSGVNRFYYGNPGDEPLMGDWDCDGEDTPAMYRRSEGLMYLRNSNTPGTADQTFYFGNPGDVPIAGDFNGNGCDTVSIYRPAEQRFFITNQLGGGRAEYSFWFGNPGDTPFVGDFDGDGVDTVGLHRVSTGRVYLTNGVSGGAADKDFIFGDPGDIVIAGDWNGDGRSTVAAYRGSNGRLYIRNSNSAGAADATLYVGSFRYAMTASGLPEYTGVVTDFEVDVEVYPGDDLAGLARSRPEGTVFRLHGTHYGQSVQPKDRQVFIGGAGATMDGRRSVRHAFRSTARNVHIQGIEITNYAPPIQIGTIEALGDGWALLDNVVHHNAGVGLKVYQANGATISGNNVHHNEQLGISVAFSTGSRVENNEIAYNNWENKYNWGFEAGGTKFWSNNGLVVRGNHSHHNHGPGLWTDNDNVGTLYEGNLLEDNYGPGILHEISCEATVRNNTARRNGFGSAKWLWGAGIVLSSSGDVTVTGNTIEGNHNGITMVQQARGSGAVCPRVMKNNTVLNNTIINSGVSGAAEDTGNKSVFTSSGNTFQGNTYRGNVRWEWNGGRISWDAWRGYGLDTSGSFAR